MKHLFHTLFVTTLLLGSLIIFSNQKGEDIKLSGENAGLEYLGLQAEVNVSQAAAFSASGARLNLGVEDKSLSSYLDRHVNLNTATFQTHLRIQRQVHRELRPLIAKQLGQNPLFHSSYEDPPAS